ncbi:MAG TPA: DUF790 family protein [Tepidisphaeraceae bacterium]|jgi:hypothetical protein|nr:DUF790 family protein [Tepidisphaeraceae bacterium]
MGHEGRLELSSEDGLKSHLPAPEESDSSVEEQFAASFGEERDGWRLKREAVVLHEGQTTFVPDFLLQHQDGREVLLEIVGFWTPQYLESKRQTLRQFGSHRILLAVAESSLRTGQAIPAGVISYRKKIDPEAVVRAAEAIAERGLTGEK